MSTPIFDPEDPKLTAYALGELTDPAEKAEVELLLQHSAEARTAMKEIEDTTLVLTAEYDHERRSSANPVEPMTPTIFDLASRVPYRRRSHWRPILAAAALLVTIGVLVSLTLPSIKPNHGAKSSAGKVAQIPKAGSPAPTGSAASVTVAAANLAEARAKLAELDEKMSRFRADRPAVRVDSVAAAAPEHAQSAADRKSINPLLADTAVASSASQTLVSPALPGAKESEAYAFTRSGREYDVNGGLTARAAAPAGPLPSIVQVQTASPMKPLAMNGMSGAGQGMGATGSGGGSARRRLSPEEMTQSKFFLRADSAAPEVTQYNTPRVAMQKNLDASDAVAVAPAAVAQSELMREFKYPTQFQPPATPTDFNTAAYDHLVENPFLSAKENPLSTFSIDVDTASYANVRRFIDGGSLPPPDAVRIEELINYFPYDYAPPTPESGKPFAVHLEAAACPWAPEHRLVRIGIKGKEIALDKRPASNLVFLIDVSGSMLPPERLPLIKAALRLLVEQLTESDHVAIVTYAGNSGLALPSTTGDHKDAILGALERLEAGGSTNGASGITLAYKVAQEGFIKGGTNRVILATDGDFNVGVTSQGELVRLIQAEAKGGVFLSALGVGTDNFKDSTMQKLADKGNGNYHYIDKLDEARKVLVEQMSGTLLTIAKDVKIQVEFNPTEVASYRLIGYEKRMLRKEDFNDDKIDAGEIGAGHSVTALYEVVPVGQPTPGETPAVDALKYGTNGERVAKEERTAWGMSASHELLTLKMRFKTPEAETSERTAEEVLVDKGAQGDYAKASPEFKFAAAVASFGLALRDSPYKGGATFGAAVELAEEGKGADAKGYRTGFIGLARRAQGLKDVR